MSTDHHRLFLQTNCLIILNKFILYHKLLKYPNNRLIAVRISTGSEHVQQVAVFIVFSHRIIILEIKKTDEINLNCPLFNLSMSTEACVHLQYSISCHLGQCMSFTMRQMLVCHLMDAVGITVE